jgi:hypothetical protein
MNPKNEEKLRALLDDVLPPSANCCGPNQTRVLELARHQHAHRRRLRATLAATTALATLALVSFRGVLPALPSSTAQTVPTPLPVASAPAPLVIRSVDDDQLLDLLQSGPSGIMEWPNGDRTVLVVMER